MKIAFATTDEKNIDEHFGRSGKFAIYEFSKDGFRFLEVRTFAEGEDRAIMETRDMGEVHEGRVQSKVDRLADCKIIYLTEIGGPSAARLVQKGIMPLKMKAVTPIEAALKQLLASVQKTPPPWLRKAMSRS
ncbi:MAG TPA: nitrogen fixation protein NifX [Nitrospirota bacterium]|nr:nitrogen fixation protein NifX [Nitrospirota bacterium]